MDTGKGVIGSLALELVNRLGRDDSESVLEELYEKYPPVPRLILYPDLAIRTASGQTNMYTYSIQEGKYIPESKEKGEKPEKSKNFVPVSLESWLLYDPEAEILISRGPGRRKLVKGVKDFAYLGFGQSYIIRDDSFEILNENLETIGDSSTLDAGLEGLDTRSFKVAYSQEYIAFLNGENNDARIFKRRDTYGNFTKMKIFSDIYAGAFIGGGNLFVFIHSNEDNKYFIGVYDIDEDRTVEERRNLPDGSYLLIVLDPDARRFITYEENTGKLTIWEVLLSGDVREEQVILEADYFTPLGFNSFMTVRGSLYRNVDIRAGHVRFEKVWEYSSAIDVSRRYPSRSGLLKVAKILAPLTPLTSLDVLEVIAGFCLERIEP